LAGLAEAADRKVEVTKDTISIFSC
jgi:hypothetical protein